MGFTKKGERRHFIEIFTGFETKALCGARIDRFSLNLQTGDPIRLNDAWLGMGTCKHCEGIYESMR